LGAIAQDAVVVQLVQAHRSAVVGHEEAVSAAPEPIHRSNAAPGRQVEHLGVVRQAEQVLPAVEAFRK
jgi:hypothetical protein